MGPKIKDEELRAVHDYRSVLAGRQYDAGDVHSALHTALAEFDADDSSRCHYTEIMNIGGASSRFFGLKQLCTRLQVTSGGAPQPAMEKLHAWSKRQQGQVTAAVRQAKRDKQVLPLLPRIGESHFPRTGESHTLLLAAAACCFCLLLATCCCLFC